MNFICSRIPRYTYLSCLLQLSRPVTVSQNFLVFWWLSHFRGLLSKCFVDCPSAGITGCFSRGQTGSVDVGGSSPRGSTVFITYQRCILSVWLLILTLNCWLRQCLLVSSLWSYFCPIFHTVLFGNKLLWAAHSWGVGSYALPAVCVEVCLHKFFKILLHGLPCFPFYLFIKFIYVSMDLWIFMLYFRIKSNTTLFWRMNFPNAPSFSLTSTSFDMSPRFLKHFLTLTFFFQKETLRSLLFWFEISYL